MSKRSKYDEYSIKEGEDIKCKICGFIILPSSRNDGSLCLHLSTCHPEILKTINSESSREKRQKTTLVPFSTPETPIEENSEPDEQILHVIPTLPPKLLTNNTQALATRNFSARGLLISDVDYAVLAMLCQDRIPITMLSGNKFRDFLKLIAPNFQLQSSDHYIHTRLPMLVANILDNIRYELSCPNKLSITLDTYKPEKAEYVIAAVYAYYLDVETFIPKKILIDYKTFKGDYFNTDILLTKVKDLVEITLKDVTCTYHDNFLNEPRDQRNETGPLPSLNRILEDIVKKAFGNSTQLILKLKSHLLENYKKYKKDGLHLSDLDQSYQMTWESLRWMLLMLEAEKWEDFSPEENVLCKVMLSLLNEIEKTQSSLRHSDYPTASVIIPTLRVLSKRIEEFCKDCSQFDHLSIFQKAISETRDMLSRCENNMTLKSATFLDPRFRGHYFESSHQEYMEEKYTKLAAKVITDFYNTDVEPTPLSTFDLFVKNRKFESSPEKVSSFTKELIKYQKEEPNSKIIPRDFWQNMEDKYPILKSLACDFLFMPATPSGAKSLFETAEAICPLLSGKEVIHENIAICCNNMEEYGF